MPLRVAGTGAVALDTLASGRPAHLNSNGDSAEALILLGKPLLEGVWKTTGFSRLYLVNSIIFSDNQGRQTAMVTNNSKTLGANAIAWSCNWVIDCNRLTTKPINKLAIRIGLPTEIHVWIASWPKSIASLSLIHI